MCLSRTDSEYHPPKPDVQLAWRVFRVKRNSFYTLFSDRVIPRGKWIKCDKRADKTQDGFYGHLNKQGARGWTDQKHVILKCKFRNITAVGSCFGWDAIVADEMFVPKAVRKTNKKPATKSVKKA